MFLIKKYHFSLGTASVKIEYRNKQLIRTAGLRLANVPPDVQRLLAYTG